MRYRQRNRLSKFSRADSSGFSLLELFISMSVLSIALTGIISAILSNTQLRKMNEEKAMARNAAEQVFSGIRGQPDIVEAYNRYGGGGTNETFTVRGLQNPAANEPVGRVIVWRLKSSLKNGAAPPQPDPGSAMILSQEDILAAQRAFTSSFPTVLDMLPNTTGTGWDDFLDTNNSGAVSSLDDPQVMPVTVRVRWRSSARMMTEYFSTVIGLR